MRELIGLKGLALLAMAAMAAAPALAQNGGFETGDLSGWTTNTDFAGATNNYGGYTPVLGGHYFAHVDAGLGQDVYSTLSQTFTLGAGETLTGYAGFKAQDYLPFNDNAYLNVNDINLLSWSVASVGNYGSSGWIRFTYTAAVAGDYTLLLGVANGGDNGLPSFAVLDRVSTTAAPEPASWAMMLGGFGLVGGTLRSRSRKLRLA